jgi:hypothetical protein
MTYIRFFNRTESVENYGLIYGFQSGLDISGEIGIILNNDSIIGINNFGALNYGTITTLTNSGTISGGSSGIYNAGAITSLINTNSITGNANGIENYGTITTLTNSGTISGGSSGIYNAGIYNAGTISTINNHYDHCLTLLTFVINAINTVTNLLDFTVRQ